MQDSLPPELTKDAILREHEYAWELAAFPQALEVAPGLKYACLGGQIWFVLPDNTLYELYWLESNSSDRIDGEPWPNYAKRSCEEVLIGFGTLIEETDFFLESKKFLSIEPQTDDSFRSKFRVMFNAYFESEESWQSLQPLKR